MIRILYISRINLLSDRTNAYNLAKTCEAMNAQENFQVRLVTTDRERDVDTFFQMMGVRKPFPIIGLGVTDTLSKYGGQGWYELFMFLSLNFHLILFCVKHAKEFDVVYFRDESLLPIALFSKLILRKKVFFEIHSVLQSKLRQFLNVSSVRFANGVIAISSGLKRYYQNVNSNILISLCSAAEDLWFDYSRDKVSFRKELGLPLEGYLIGYTGVVGANPNNDYYELDDIVKSLVNLPAEIFYIIVGELTSEGEWLRDVAKQNGVKSRVIILPWQDRSKIPKYLQAFDVILVPKRKKDLIGDSPAKMFQALATQRPIIAGRAECIEEVLTDGVDAVIVEQNNADGWAKAILKIYENSELAKKLSDRAWLTKDKYTWEKRGGAIAEFIIKTIITK